MKLTISTLLGAACLAVGMLSSQTTAKAGDIFGEIDFSGIATTDTGKLSSAKAFVNFTDVKTFGPGTGTYAGLADSTSVTMSPFTFNPTGKGVSPLWSIDGGTYTFNLLAVTEEIYNKGTMGLTIIGDRYRLSFWWRSDQRHLHHGGDAKTGRVTSVS